jgi:hypothetical protein
LLEHWLAATLARLGCVRLRHAPPSPDGGVIADYLGRDRTQRWTAQTLRLRKADRGDRTITVAMTA